MPEQTPNSGWQGYPPGAGRQDPTPSIYEDFSGGPSLPQYSELANDAKRMREQMFQQQRSLFAAQQTISELRQANRQAKDDADVLQSDVAKLASSIQDEQKLILQVRNKTMEPLAVFVGLFTFASISFQIFSNVHDFNIWSALLVIVMGALTIFAGLVIHAASLAPDVKERRMWTGGIILVGLLLMVYGSWLLHGANTVLQARYSSQCVELQPTDKQAEADGLATERYCREVK